VLSKGYHKNFSYDLGTKSYEKLVAEHQRCGAYMYTRYVYKVCGAKWSMYTRYVPPKPYEKIKSYKKLSHTKKVSHTKNWIARRNSKY